MKARIAWRLFQKTFGFRYLMDVVLLDPSAVRGSDVRLPDRPDDGPLFACTSPREEAGRVEMTPVKAWILDALFGRR